MPTNFEFSCGKSDLASESSESSRVESRKARAPHVHRDQSYEFVKAIAREPDGMNDEGMKAVHVYSSILVMTANCR